MIRWVAAFALGLAVVPEALACGGPAWVDLYQPLMPISSQTNGWLYDFDGFETIPHPDVRFLGPALRMAPEKYQPLWDAVYPAPYSEEPRRKVVDQPTAAGTFLAAAETGDVAAMEPAARAVVQEMLDRAAITATEGEDMTELRLAVEFSELKGLFASAPKEQVKLYFRGDNPRLLPPALQGAFVVRTAPREEAAKTLAAAPKHPRRASLRLRMLQESMRTGIPDGWDVYGVREAMPAGQGQKLITEIDQWLTDFPDHPLADYVRLYKLRVWYITGESALAWKLLVDEYPKHPVRILGEMRFMEQQGSGPEGVDLKKLPTELVPVLIRHTALSEEDWNSWWKLADANPGAPWAKELQRQLMLQLIDGSQPYAKLPTAFPLKAEAPDPDWSMLRLAVLALYGEDDAAWAQSELGGSGPFAPIRAQLRLRKSDWVGAICEPGIDESARSYLIRVLAPDKELAKLAKSGPDGVREEANATLAFRQAADGDWSGAAKRMGPAWKEVAKEAKKRKSDPLRWARYMQAHRGELFVGSEYDEVVWYRSMWSDYETYGQAADLPWTTAQQQEAQEAWIKSSFEDYYALSAYATLLDRTSEAELRAKPEEWMAIIEEADGSYNKLLNYGNGDYYIWGAVIPSSEQAVSVRKAGKIVRAELRANAPR